jgi:hypothetical protein
MIQVLDGAWTPSSSRESGERLAECRDELGAEPLAFRARKTNELARRAERHREFDGLVEILADADVGVVTDERDLAEAGGPYLIAHHVGARHRERPWSARHLIRRTFVRNDLAHAELGRMEPGIVLALSPDDHHELAGRSERFSHVLERGNWRRKEHGTEARECGIVRAGEISGLKRPRRRSARSERPPARRLGRLAR